MIKTHSNIFDYYRSEIHKARNLDDLDAIEREILSEDNLPESWMADSLLDRVSRLRKRILDNLVDQIDCY